MSDEYSKQVQNEQPSLNEKLADARAFIASHKTVLLTTRSPNGQLHARTMAIAEVTPDWKFRFIYDGESYKEKEVDNECVLRLASRVSRLAHLVSRLLVPVLARAKVCARLGAGAVSRVVS